MSAAAALADMSVNEVIRHFPASIEVFNAWRIDACCGGANTVRTVAQRHGVDLANLLADLERVIATPDTSVPACSL